MRFAFNLVKPDIHKRLEGQERQNAACDQHQVICSFKVGDPVYAQNYRPGLLLKPAYVTELMGHRRYGVSC